MGTFRWIAGIVAALSVGWMIVGPLGISSGAEGAGADRNRVRSEGEDAKMPEKGRSTAAQKEVPLPTCFYHFGEFVVPADTGNPWADPSQKCLVGHFMGTGKVEALCYRTNYYGVWFGFEIDDYPVAGDHLFVGVRNVLQRFDLDYLFYLFVVGRGKP